MHPMLKVSAVLIMFLVEKVVIVEKWFFPADGFSWTTISPLISSDDLEGNKR